MIMKTYNRFEIEFVKGKGCYLYDNEGEKYLDFVAGIAVNSLGHCHPELVKTLKTQGESLWHISNLYYNKSQKELSEKLIKLSDHQSVFFCNSGTEAVEGALKVARKYGKKTNSSKILYFNNSFHGRSLGALSVTGREKYQKDFKPLIQGTQSIPFNDKEKFAESIGDDVCAVILEPIQGEGGINPIDSDFLSYIKEKCDAHNALLIFDEVQCGIGRTGAFYAYQIYDVVPDVICLAKGLGGGLPIGAFIVNKKADVLVPGDHGSTYGGNPLVTSVSNVLIDIVSKQSFLNQITEKSKYLKKQLEKLKAKKDSIVKIKGIGLMIGIEVTTDVKAIVKDALDNKLLIVNAGKNTIRLVPPLTVTKEEIDHFVNIFETLIE